MNTIPLLTLLFFITILSGTNAQWYIIKKDYPSNLMNYPSPGKRSISNGEFNLFNIDCSIPSSYLNSYEEKLAWLKSCRYQKSLSRVVNNHLSSFNPNNIIENKIYSTPRLILHERRTLRSSSPYFYEYSDLFNQRLLKRLQRSINK